LRLKQLIKKKFPIKEDYDYNFDINVDIPRINDESKIKVKDILKQEQIDFVPKENNEEIKRLELYPCGLVMGTYIIAQNDEAMYLIDQHAAQERINYERILKALTDKKMMITSLLIPITIELTPSDYLHLMENINVLTNLGFVIEEFGINTIMIKAHPTWLIEGVEEETIKDIIDYVIALPKDFDPIRFNDHISKTAACKMSVKGNTNITMDQASSLLKDLVLCDNPYNCPHGRPTIITFTKYELERMFKRVMN
jgi:DNA mismatch repair protein MutL